MNNIIEDISTYLSDNPISEEERLKLKDRLDKDQAKMKEYHKGYLEFKNMHYFCEASSIASTYSKDRFLFDVVNRAIGVLSIKDIDSFYKKLSLAYDEMSMNSKVYLLDSSVVSFTLTAIKDVYSEKRNNSEEDYALYDTVGMIQTNINVAISKNTMHRLVLEPILEKHFKEFSFELSQDETVWNGLEFPTASGGGFGERTTFESINYKVEEQGESIKKDFFCSLAVYFMDIRRAKQTYAYKHLILKEKSVFNANTLLNISNGIKAIKKADYI